MKKILSWFKIREKSRRISVKKEDLITLALLGISAGLIIGGCQQRDEAEEMEPQAASIESVEIVSCDRCS